MQIQLSQSGRKEVAEALIDSLRKQNHRFRAILRTEERGAVVYVCGGSQRVAEVTSVGVKPLYGSVARLATKDNPNWPLLFSGPYGSEEGLVDTAGAAKICQIRESTFRSYVSDRFKSQAPEKIYLPTGAPAYRRRDVEAFGKFLLARKTSGKGRKRKTEQAKGGETT